MHSSNACERKKKKQVRTYRENRSKKSARGFKEQVAPQRLVEDFGLFARKVSALPKRKLRRWYQEMFAQGTRYHAFLQKCSHTLRIFGACGVKGVVFFVCGLYDVRYRWNGVRGLFSKKNFQIFSGIDTLAVSMSEKFFCQHTEGMYFFISRKVGRIPLLQDNVIFT